MKKKGFDFAERTNFPKYFEKKRSLFTQRTIFSNKIKNHYRFLMNKRCLDQIFENMNEIDGQFTNKIICWAIEKKNERNEQWTNEMK